MEVNELRLIGAHSYIAQARRWWRSNSQRRERGKGRGRQMAAKVPCQRIDSFHRFALKNMCGPHCLVYSSSWMRDPWSFGLVFFRSFFSNVSMSALQKSAAHFDLSWFVVGLDLAEEKGLILQHTDLICFLNSSPGSGKAVCLDVDVFVVMVYFFNHFRRNESLVVCPSFPV